MMPAVYNWLVAGAASSPPEGPAELCGNRIYYGQAAKDSATPRVVWALSSGRPENYLGEASAIDNARITINCWAKTMGAASALYNLCRAVLEQYGQQVGFNGCIHETNTGLFNYTTDWSIWLARGTTGSDPINMPGGGSGVTYISEYAENGNVFYVGEAEEGSLTSEAVWHITRLTFNADGDFVASAETGETAIWDNYLTETYS